PPCLLSQGDDAERRHPGGDPAGQGARDPACGRAGEDGGDHQEDPVKDIEEVKLLCGHFPTSADGAWNRWVSQSVVKSRKPGTNSFFWVGYSAGFPVSEAR